jgi:serine/threonine-protein kinase
VTGLDRPTVHSEEVFGHYRLTALLGSGGFGEVWRAYDTRLDRTVALKLLQGRGPAAPEAVARFRREAQMVGRLRHPNIVRVHSFGEIDGRLYLDMELIEGTDLRTLLADAGALAPARALRIAEQVADALDAAHGLDGPPAARAVHRDVKPANVLLEWRRGGRDEHVYLADFGVARAVLGGTAVTREGYVNGTAEYVAPELWEGAAYDHRVDVYALAVMLFEMVTGRLPFTAPSVEALIAAHLTKPPPAASRINPRLPARFDNVVAIGLAKNPDHRFQQAGELIAAAAAALRDGEPAHDEPTVVPAPTRASTAPATRSGPPPTAASPPPLPRPAPPPLPRPAPPPSGPGSRSVAAPVGPDEQPRSRESRARRTPYLASRRHFIGLGLAALLIPIYLFNLLPVDATLPLFAVGLYALGALGAGLLSRAP